MFHSAVQHKNRPARPLRWVLDRVGSIWFGVTMLALIFAYSSIGSAVPPVRQGQLADWFGLELLRFEKTEMEWFAWWPFQVMVGLFCLSIIVVTLRRIPLTLPNAGVWTVHTGILVTAVACGVYFGTKVEGDTVLFQSRARIHVPGGPETTLVMRPKATIAIATPARRYEFQVLEMNPDYTIRSDPDQGQQTQQIWIQVTAEPPLTVPGLDQPVSSFVRTLLVGFPEHTEDVVLTAKGPQRTVKALGTKLLDRDLEITLERDPVAYFYHAHSPPVRSNGALYARFDLRADWMELRLPYLPHYCEHVSDPSELWPSSSGPQPVARPLDIRAAPPAAASDLQGLDFRVTDYLPYAILEPRFLKGAEDAPLNPLVRFTLASEQRTESRELLARDPQLHKQPLAEGFDAEFAWAESSDERAALLAPSNPPVPGLLMVGGADSSLVDVVVTGAGGLRESYAAAVGTAFALAPDVNMTVDALWPHAREEIRPAITPAARRASLADVGKNASLIRVEVNDGHHVTSTWLSFNEYPFTDEQHAQPERFRYAPRSVRLADGRVLWLLYSRWRERLPDPVALDRFVLRTHPGGDAPSDYVSRVAFQGPTGWTDDVEVRSNRPARHGDLWFFQAKWDPGTEAHTVLGVGNRHGVHAMLAGVLMAIAGMVYAFYVKPVIIRRRQQAALAAARQRHAATVASAEEPLPAPSRAGDHIRMKTAALKLCGEILSVLSLVATASSAFGAVDIGVADPAFVANVNLERFRLVAVQHDGRFKTFDTLARAIIQQISGSSEFTCPLPDGRVVHPDPAFIYLDLLFNAEAYRDVRLIQIRKQPIRDALTQAAADHLDAATLAEVRRDGRVSLRFLALPEVTARLRELNRDVLRTTKEVEALADLAALADPRSLARLLRVIPPPAARSGQQRWFSIEDLAAASAHAAVPSGAPADILPGLSPQLQNALSAQWAALQQAWITTNAIAANAALDSLTQLLRQCNLQVYPPAGKLALEHWYYHYNKLMWTWFFYFLALVLLLMGAVYRWPGARRAGTVFFGLGFSLHTLACGIRWYLAGRIPNSNMFEAVTAAAWFGAALAIFLELGPALIQQRQAWRAAIVVTSGGLALWLVALPIRGIAYSDWQRWGPAPIAGLLAVALGGAALLSLAVARRMSAARGLPLLGASAAGMAALMCGQFLKSSLDSDIGRTMPVLSDLWLYIHTNMVIASYALIGMAFVTASIGVVGRMLAGGPRKSPALWLSMAAPLLAVPALALLPGINLQMVTPAWSPFLVVFAGYGLALAVSWAWKEGARRAEAVWAGLPPAASALVGPSCLAPATVGLVVAGGALAEDRTSRWREGDDAAAGLARVLDNATMLLLELSFITLWTGIIMGAIWADHSWGRPWGWDPKEVFALNTWIIFLILVHVRLKVRDKALWTAILAVVGTAVMMFNWVVVNFFIVGLHSYA